MVSNNQVLLKWSNIIAFAMSAAIYSARKGLDAALIAKKLRGQITYTASVS